MAAGETSAGDLHVFCAYQELLDKSSVSLGILSASFKEIVLGLNHKAGILKEVVDDPFIYRSEKKLY